MENENKFKSMKIKELRELAKTLNIKNITSFKKEELIDIISKINNTKNTKPVKNESNEETSYQDPIRKTNLVEGVLEILSDGYGFLRCNNYQSGENDIYVPINQIKRFNLKTGDYIVGNSRMQHDGEKFEALLYVQTVNGDKVDVSIRRKPFEDLTPIYPTERLILENKDLPEIEELKEQISRLDDLYEYWKLHTMGLYLSSNVVVKKETKELEAKFASSADFVNPH